MLYTGRMTTIHFKPEAHRALAETYRTDESLSNMYDYNFDLLQADHSDLRVRRHRHTRDGVDAWHIYVVIPGRPQRYAIIWDEKDGEVWVHYLGPWL